MFKQEEKRTRLRGRCGEKVKRKMIMKMNSRIDLIKEYEEDFFF